jgi:iron-sulfur cluster repair protein YtfE (RIC family)
MSTAENKKIDVTVMYATHDAFRRDLERLVEAASAHRTESVRGGWKNFMDQLHLHHTVEDAVLWPRVDAAVANRPRDLELMAEMKAEHAQLDPLLDAVEKGFTENSADLAERVRKLSVALGEHMKHEEASALPLIQEVLTPKDWSAFRGAMARKQGPKGAAIYIPWVMDGASEEDRRKFLNAMPAPVGVLNRMFWESRYRKRNLWGVSSA